MLLFSRNFTQIWSGSVFNLEDKQTENVPRLGSCLGGGIKHVFIKPDRFLLKGQTRLQSLHFNKMFWQQRNPSTESTMSWLLCKLMLLLVPVWKTWSALQSADWAGWQPPPSLLAPAGSWFSGCDSTKRRGQAALPRCHFSLHGLLPVGPDTIVLVSSLTLRRLSHHALVQLPTRNTSFRRRKI